MRERMILGKLQLQNMLHTLFHTGNGKRKRGMSVAAGLALLAVLALFLSSVYSLLFAMSLKLSGVPEFYFPLMILLAMAVSLFFSFMAAKGIVFGGKDLDFLLSLPVSSFSVMLSKLSALYLENLVFIGLWMLPTAAAGWFLGFVSDPLFWLRLLPTILLMPCLPSLLAAMAGYLAAWVQSKIKRRSLLGSLLYVLLFLAFFFSYMQINRLGELMLEHRENVARLFRTWLLPVGLLSDGLAGNWSSWIAGLLLTALPFLAFAWIISRRYQQVLSSLKAQTLRTDFKLSSLKGRSPFAALLAKETERLFYTPIYLLNAGVGVVILIGLCIYLILQKNKLLPFLSLLKPQDVSALCLAAIVFLLATLYPSAVSLSLENKNLWLLKEMPLKPTLLFAAKAALNLTLAWPASLAALILLGAAGFFSLPDGLLMLPVCLSFTGFLALAGVLLNLRFPKLDSDNDTIVIKQSFSAIFACFGGILLSVLAGAAWFFLRRLLPFPALCLFFTVLFAILSWIAWQLLKGWGSREFDAL
ncbi:MAG: hypothetical protein Q4C65_13630 [Eubacteriales bacterium]|nr:hypothetical protein [Eubacteriales bacterium]